MTQRRDLLRAVALDPDDDTPRLIYADWLEEQGGERDAARAEFIRLQIAVARDFGAASVDAWGWDVRWRLERDLIVRHGAGWLADELPQWAAQQIRQSYPWPNDTFTRGFVEEARLHPRPFILWGRELFDLAPLTGVNFPVKDLATLRRLADCPHLSRLRSLDVSGGQVGSVAIGDAGATVLADSPHLAGLEELDLCRANLTDAGARALARSRAFPGLRVLDLSGNGLTETGVEALLDSPHFPALEAVELGAAYAGWAWITRLSDRFPDKTVVV
jgi:uncharacterized protein (TIGR02996 family)